jgi:hypothetical protein
MRSLTYVALFAFSAVTVCATDLTGKIEVDGFAGGVHITNPDNGVHANDGVFGFSGGYGVASMVQIFGEYSYIPIGNDFNISVRVQNFGGGVKINLLPKSDKYEPYGLFEFGGSHFSDNAGDASTTNKAVHLGGGVRIYAGSKKWGFTPEFRWIHISSNGNATNVIAYTGGIFFQFGK